MFRNNIQDDDEQDGKEKLPPQPDPLLEKVKAMILDTYEPVQEPKEADLRLTTSEIYEMVYKLYPNPIFTHAELANWLHEKGFTFWDSGKMRFEWLLKSVTTSQ